MNNLFLSKSGFYLLAIIIFLMAPALCLAEITSPITHVTVLHTGDTHGYVLPFETEVGTSVGGAASRMAFVNEIKTANKENGTNCHTLLLDAGDVLENHFVSNYYKGEADFKVMNMMKYDAMTLGNHEFGFGMDNFLKLEKMAKFPILSANILDRKTGNFLFKPYVIKECGSLKIAIFGLTSHTILYNSEKAVLDRITILKPEEAYSRIYTEMKEKSDFIIFLSHLGIEEDREFAKKHPEIRLIAGSHSHTYMKEPEMAGGTMIIHTGKYGECLGRVNLKFMGKKLYSINGRVIFMPDQEMNKISKQLKNEIDPILNEKLGDCPDTIENTNKFEQQSPLFGFVLKNLKEYAQADMAMETAASLGWRLKKGPVYVHDIYKMMPYNNFVVIIKMKGSEIKALMDFSVSKKTTNTYIQVSGITFDERGKKAENLKINGQPLEMDKLYKVATDNYMTAGGAEDGILSKIEDGRKEFQHKLIRDIIIDNIKNKKAF